MVRRAKYIIASVVFVAITSLSVALTTSCRKPRQAEDDQVSVEQAGAPERYSATVIRTTFQGTSSETYITRETQAGEMRRQEWAEGDQRRALIWRPDLGKSFLLNLDKREYVELNITAGHMGTAAGNPDIASSSPNARDVNPGDGIPSIDHYFDDSQSPARVETRTLSPVVVDGHACKVYEQRTIFLDGHIETTRRFRADELEGLAVRIDCESEQGGVRVTTERRDVSLLVTTDSFEVPPGFKKIERLR